MKLSEKLSSKREGSAILKVLKALYSLFLPIRPRIQKGKRRGGNLKEKQKRGKKGQVFFFFLAFIT